MVTNRKRARQSSPNRNRRGGASGGHRRSRGWGGGKCQSGRERGRGRGDRAADARGPLPSRPPKMEFLLGNPFSTPVGQCLGKALTAASRDLGGAPRVAARRGPAPRPSPAAAVPAGSLSRARRAEPLSAAGSGEAGAPLGRLAGAGAAAAVPADGRSPGQVALPPTLPVTLCESLPCQV